MKLRILESLATCLVAIYMWGAWAYEDITWLFPLDQWQSLFFWFYLGFGVLYLLPYWVIESLTDSSWISDILILAPPVGCFLLVTYG